MRVYPLPAKGSRRVVLAFEQELTDKGNNDLYLLPLKINESVRKFSIHVEVIKNKVELNDALNELTNLSFDKWNDSYVADFVKDNFIPNKQIALSFPLINVSEKVFTAKKNNRSDSSYFYVNIRPQLMEHAKELPKRITLLWDNSNSTLERNIEKEITILDNYIQKIGNLSIELIPFNIKTEKSELLKL